MDFSIEYISTLSTQKLSNFEEGQRGRFLKLISLYLTILFVEKNINENETRCNGGVIINVLSFCSQSNLFSLHVNSLHFYITEGCLHIKLKRMFQYIILLCFKCFPLHVNNKNEKELLLFLTIIYIFSTDEANHVNVEAHLAPPTHPP